MNESQMTEVFGSQGRFRALRALFAEPGRGFGQRELAAESGIDPGNVARMLKRWTQAGLVIRRQQDGLPRYYASPAPELAPLATLMQQGSRLVSTLRSALSELRGVEVAVVFGSVARGQANADSDVDVLILGNVSEIKANAALKPAGRELKRSIRCSAYKMEAFIQQLRDGDGFAQEVLRSPRITLVGDFDASVFPESESTA